MSLFFDVPEKIRKKHSSSGKAKKSTGVVLSCDQCGLYKSCLSPKMAMTGKGRKKILIIAEAPGRTEDEEGIQLIGQSGQILRKTLDDLGYDLDKDFWKTNAVICRPPNNRTPTNFEINACRKNLLKVIEETNPIAIIPLGAVSWKSLMAPRLVGRINGMEFSDFVGFTIPDQETKRWICPTYHPSYILRMEHDAVLYSVWKSHLQKSLEVADIPIKPIDFESRIEIVEDVDRAKQILSFIKTERNDIAFDYETTGIKPHAKGHEIISVAFSDGNQAWAFPMFKDQSFQNRLVSLLEDHAVMKIAHYSRFERLWTKQILQGEINNLGWDTCIAAHCLNSSKSSQLKFLTYVNFGILGYDSEIDSFISAEDNGKGKNGFNRLKEVPIQKLLGYNAADPLFTYWLYQKQKKEMTKFQLDGFTLFMQGDQVLLEAHQNGMQIDTKTMNKQRQRAENKLERLELSIMESKEVKKWDGKEKFNFSSSTQLSHLLFNILNVKVKKLTAKDKPSTDAEALSEIKLPFIKDILEHKRWTKINGTYISQFIREEVDGLVHPFFNLNTVVTFRSSSSDPNFQNIPKHDQEAMNFIRKFIIPRPGHRLIEYDYGAMEVRILSCYNKDPALIKFINEGYDMHRDIAAKLFQKKPEDITKVERQAAKNGFVFPTFYGSFWENTAKNIWQNLIEEDTFVHLKALGIKRMEDFQDHVEKVEKKFWDMFPTSYEWMEKTVRSYQKKGFIDLFTGFRCYGPMKRTEIINYRVQGSAFHCLLWTITQVSEKMKELQMESHFIGQIHDSAIPDTLPSEEKKLDELMKDFGTKKIREHWDWIIVPLIIEKSRSEIDGNFAEMTGYGVL